MTGKAVYGAGAGFVVDKLAILSLRGTKGRSNLFVKRANLNIHYSLWPFFGLSQLLCVIVFQYFLWPFSAPSVTLCDCYFVFVS